MVTAQGTRLPIDLPMDKIADFCRRWRIAEFALFGSVIRDDFRPDSDIDVLITFVSDVDVSPDRLVMRQELEAMFGHRVDLVFRRVIEHDSNYILRKAILRTAKVIYAA